MSNGKFAGGDGSESNPYLIEDAFDLDAVRNGLDKSYKLIKNIDLNINPFNTGEGWIPIGIFDYTKRKMFRGSFNGNGHNIKNLYINNPNIDYLGLFGSAFDILIKNIGIINIKINGKNSIGGLLGSVGGASKIINCYTSGSINGDTIVGGITGSIDHTTSITNCYSNCIVNGNSSIGGLVGKKYSAGTVILSFWDKDISTQNISSGGGIGLTTEQMKNPQTFIDADWDKEKTDDGKNVWILKDGQYPKLWFEVSPNKFLIKQNNDYYSIKSNFYSIGQPTDNTQLENWYNKYGADDINIITQMLNNKEIPMSKNENDIWKTDFELDANEIIDSIDMVDTDENNKSIKYDCNDYKIFDLLNDEFDIMMAK